MRPPTTRLALVLLAPMLLACDQVAEPIAVVVEPAADTLAVGQTRQLSVAVVDANDQPVTDRAVTWSSSNDAVVAVSGAGLVTAVSGGTATITAAVPGASGTAAITVASSPTGGWIGTTTGITLTLSLTEASAAITGSGVMSMSGGSVTLDATGTYAFPDITIALTTEGYWPMQFSGAFAGNDQIIGQFTGAGLVDAHLVLIRASGPVATSRTRSPDR